MKNMADVGLALRLALREISPGLVKTGLVQAAGLVIAACVLAIAQSSPQIQLPQVRLDADGLAPRAIEELTGTTVARHYALAWRDLAGALESSQPTDSPTSSSDLPRIAWCRESPTKSKPACTFESSITVTI
jgi:hypothetical protein